MGSNGANDKSMKGTLIYDTDFQLNYQVTIQTLNM